MTTGRKWVALLALLLPALGGSIVGYDRWRHHQVFIDTDDAYVKGHIYTVSSRIPGPLATVNVQENQEVKAGQVIATLDPRDYDDAIIRAEASLAESGASLATDKAAIAQARAQVEAAQSQLDLAQIERARLTALYEQKSMPKQEFDRAVTAEQVARTRRVAAQRAVEAATAALEVSRRKVEVSGAALETARLQRSYCAITAPVDGVVSRKMAEVGQVVTPGQPLCAVVPLGLKDLWVEANYKETELRNVRPGQKVQLRADIEGDHTYTGTVESLSAGTGAAFSLLPPENATGNWVKVVQRVPVKIRIDPSSGPDDHRLRLGLSMTVEIDTRSR